MKRIIDGVTYNTDTSTRLAVSEFETEYNHNNYPCIGTLYQTRGGAFFVHQYIDLGYNKDIEENDYRDRFVALNETEAHAWLLAGEVEVFNNPFDDPPEAEAESRKSATIYVRVPVSLKKRLEKAASAEKLSGNAWSIRCIERCLEPQERLREQIGVVWGLAKDISLGVGDYMPNSEVSGIAEGISTVIETLCRELGFANLADLHAFTENLGRQTTDARNEFKALGRSC